MPASLTSLRSEILDHFICKNTGNCCLSPGYVYVTPSDIQAMAKDLQLAPDQFSKHFVKRINGWNVIASPNFRTRCFLTEHNQCQVYSSRPEACRSYPDWDVIWDSDASLLQEAKLCKGLSDAIQTIKISKKPF
tara:strand:- start:470 stop:871 length:402 start_codon:yes stop_codon:yes gene_type:complete